MKKARGDTPIHTIPSGVYEGGIIHEKIKENHHSSLTDMATDIQNNGYPINHSDEPKKKQRSK